MALTKSLHTVTATVNVAKLVLRTRQPVDVLTDGIALADAALAVLGYAPRSMSDPTYAQIVRQCEALVKGGA